MSANGLSGTSPQRGGHGRFKKKDDKKEDVPIQIVKAKEFIQGQGRIQPDNIRTEVQIGRGVQGFLHEIAEGFATVEFPYGAGSAFMQVSTALLASV